jgi:hypothetical protein
MTNWLERAQTVFRKTTEPEPSIGQDTPRTTKKSPDPELPILPKSAPVVCGDGDWPPESIAAERRFGQPHAKLFPFLGRKVRTPGGPGTLLQVFADRVTVLLDSDLDKCAVFSPEEIGAIVGRGSD